MGPLWAAGYQTDKKGSWTQQLHRYLLIDLIIVRWSAAHRGLPGTLIKKHLMGLAQSNIHSSGIKFFRSILLIFFTP